MCACAAHGFALFALWFANLDAAWAALLALVVGVHAVWLDRGLARLRIALRADGSLANYSDGGTAPDVPGAAVDAESRVWGPLVVLVVTDDARRHRHVLMADSVAHAADWAALRRAIRWQRQGGASAPG